MSLQSELTRLQANVTSILSSKDDIMTALASKGVSIPSGATLHDVPRLIGDIPGRAPEPVTTVTIGGRAYPTVKIGSQWWMAENLDYKFQYNGSTLPIGGSATSTPKAWYYNDNELDYGINGSYKCGLLYNWYATKYLDDNKTALLPDGWHVPTHDEWDALATFIGSGAGTKLKAEDNSVTSSWPSGYNGTNEYGFNALPNGCYVDYNGGYFAYVDTDAYFWSSSTGTLTNASYFHYLTAERDYLGSNENLRTYGHAIRLVRTVA